MKGLRTAVWLAAILAMGGCYAPAASPPAAAAPGASQDPPPLNPALCPTAHQCLQASGGFAAWQNASTVRVAAVVTVYGPEQGAYVNQEELTIDLKNATLEATCQTPTGAWTAHVDAQGHASLAGAGLPADPELRKRLADAHAIIAHRYRGAVNLLAGRDAAADASDAVVDGVDVTRVGVRGKSAGPRAYYFGRTDRLLRFLTAGADKPGGKGTVTVYEYKWHPKGLALPAELRVVRIGQNVLVGREPGDLVLEAAFSNARL